MRTQKVSNASAVGARADLLRQMVRSHRMAPAAQTRAYDPSDGEAVRVGSVRTLEVYDALGHLRLRSERLGPEGSRTVLLTQQGERPADGGLMVLLSAGLLRRLLNGARPFAPRRRARRIRKRLDIRI